jgi:hypothetical protein
MTDAPADWLVALGYPSLDPASPPPSHITQEVPIAA